MLGSLRRRLEGPGLLLPSTAGVTVCALVGGALAAIALAYIWHRVQPSTAARSVELVPDTLMKRNIKRGEIHWFELMLQGETYAQINVDQREIDVSLIAVKPNGDLFPPVDFGPFGRESMSIAAELPGVYRLGVRAPQDSTAQGRYEIRWSEKRPVQPDDMKRMRAQAAFAEAQQQAATERSSAKAITLYQEAVALWAATGDRRGEASALDHLGIAYDRTGRLESAYDCYTKALHLWESLQDEYGRLEALRQLGRLNWHLGERFSIVPSDEEFLRLWKRLDDRRGEAVALEALSGDSFGSKNYALGIDYATKAMAMDRAMGDQKGEIQSLEVLVGAHVEVKEFDQALKLAVELLHRNQLAGDRRGEAASLDRIGFVLQRRGRFSEAANYFERALSLREPQGDQGAQISLHDALARMALLMDDPQKALPHARAAMAIEASLRAGLKTSKWREGFSGFRDLTTLYVQTLMALHAKMPDREYSTEAFLAADLAHGRIVSDEISGPHTTIAKLQSELLDSDTVLLEYSLGRDFSPPDPTAADMLKIPQSFLWILTRQSVFEVTLPPRYVIENLVRQAYSQLSTPPPAPGQSAEPEKEDEAIRALSHALLGSVAPYLSAKRLLVVCDGLLQYVPFGALFDPTQRDGTPLIANHEIREIPSAIASLILQRERASVPKPRHLLAVIADPVFSRDDPRFWRRNAGLIEDQHSVLSADLGRAVRAAGMLETIPRLPYSRREATWALQNASAQDSVAFLDFAATRELLQSGRLRDYRIIDIATHGFVSDEDPDLSGLVFSLVDRNGRPKEGYFRLRDLSTLRLPSELIVLSACRSGIGKIINGEGMLSLTSGFLHAGAGAVLATTWQLNDESTAEFMKLFYAELLGPRQRSPAAALQSAQMSFHKSPRWHARYFWAGFVLYGAG